MSGLQAFCAVGLKAWTVICKMHITASKVLLKYTSAQSTIGLLRVMS
jgi:hypothetical protein